MITAKQIRYYLIAVLLTLTFSKTLAQDIDEQTYLHKMQLIDNLSLYKMKDFDTLCQVSVLNKFRGNEYRQDYYGWINKQNGDHISLLNINGKEYEIEKKEITEIKPVPLTQETIDSLISRDKKHLVDDWGNFAENYELTLWLYKKGKNDYSKQLLPDRQILLTDTNIRNGFGWIYYDAMLSAYSNERDYAKAITFGEHLSGIVFKGFEYQKEAVTLTRQLKNNLEDFKTFRLPDSLEWSSLKEKLGRKEQILYLADRLRLLNCIQPGQPAGISYGMNQYSIPITDARKLNVSYWDRNTKYMVTNPFIELLQMKPSLIETELLLPYLLTDAYIVSYNYHRDFFRERNLHKLNWVVESLISDITNKLFFDRFDFDSLTLDQKKTEVEKIKKWCDDNAALSAEALTVKELKTASSWNDFHAALRTARQQKNDSLLSIIVQRFNDFHDRSWRSCRGIMAQNIYELADEKYIGAIKKWNKDTTDKWVNLWTSMFLIKYDKQSYIPAMKELQEVLKQCDGTTYYPLAMDMLLSIHDKNALKLAEGILDKSEFQRFINWGYYVNFIRKLLIAKSDYTFEFLVAKLDACTPDEMKKSHKDNDHVLTQNDTFILTVDELKSDTPEYYKATTNIARQEYIKALDKWFKAQYTLLKSDKPNELHLDVKDVSAPVSFVDTYYR